MADLLEIEAKTTEPTIPKQIYPMVEEMTFRGIIQSEAEGMKLLRAVQILVNELGAAQIIAIMDKMEQKPALMQKAKTYLPYLMML